MLPLLGSATLAAARAQQERYAAQVGVGPTWAVTRLSGDGIATSKTQAAAGTLEGWVLTPAPTTPTTTGSGQVTVDTDPHLLVTGEALPQHGDILTLSTDTNVRYRVGGIVPSVLYPTYLVEAL